MYDEPFLINPPRRKRRRGVRRRRRNAPKGRRRRPVLYGPARGPWKRSAAYRKRSRKRRVTLQNPALAMVGNPRRRRRSYRRRRNPAMTVQGVTSQLQNVLPLAVTGIASGIIVNMVPGFIGLTNPWANLGIKTGVALLGGPMVSNMVGRDHGLVWTVVGISSVVQDLVKQFMPGVIPGLGYSEYYDATQVGAYPTEVGAFPVDGVGAYEEGSDYLNTYAEMGESPYPY